MTTQDILGITVLILALLFFTGVIMEYLRQRFEF